MWRNALAKEVAIVLLLKIILIYLLWIVCFAHPLDRQLTASNIASHVLVSSSNSESL